MSSHPLTKRLYLELGARVRRKREVLDLTQDELAFSVGISRSSIANIERGRQHAPVHLLFQLAEELHVGVSDLLPTRDELVALVDASRDVPKLVSIGGEARLMPAGMVQLVGEMLTRPTKTKAPSNNRRRGAAPSTRRK